MEPLTTNQIHALRLATKPNNPRGIITAPGSVKRTLIQAGYATGRGTITITDAGRDAITRHDNDGLPTAETIRLDERIAAEQAAADNTIDIDPATLTRGDSIAVQVIATGEILEVLTLATNPDGSPVVIVEDYRHPDGGTAGTVTETVVWGGYPDAAAARSDWADSLLQGMGGPGGDITQLRGNWDGELTGGELWSIAEAAEHIGASSAGSARKTLSRWGVTSAGRQPGRGGESLYRADEVRAAKAGRPGRGTRTDLGHLYDWGVHHMGGIVEDGSVRAADDETAMQLALTAYNRTPRSGGDADMVVRRRGHNAGAGNWVQYDAEVVRIEL